MWEAFRSNFTRGLVIIIPVVITVWLLNTVFVALDRITASLYAYFGLDIPGLGLLTMVVVILVVGILSRNLIGKIVLNFIDRAIKRIPIVKTIYSAVKDVIAAFSTSQGGKSFKQVVVVEYPRKGIFSIGFVTNDLVIVSSHTKREKDLVSVYFPHPPNPTSGVMVLVPKKDVRVLKISVEEGLKLALSGGIVAPKEIEELKSL